MNELYVFIPSALVAAGMGGWALKGWHAARNTKAALLKNVDEAVSALEALEKKNTSAQQAADDATLLALKNRLHSL